MSVLRRKRTHSCGALRIDDVGSEAYLVGWIFRRRDHGGIIFLDLRDREGFTQITLDPQEITGLDELGSSLKLGSCIGASGEVISRFARGGEKGVNKQIPTGEIEILASSVDIYSVSDPLPFSLEEETDATEMMRMRYRYLDIRRGPLLRNLALRSKVALEVRNYFHEQSFMEVETPILTKSTPEGARDYLVPSRVNAGHFYALPQSPQLYKQILMIAGVERYYQIARCFRDEDLRADRQPEFTQIDFEMSFFQPEELYALVEGLFTKIFERVFGKTLQTPFARMTYKEAFERYGEDKPDIRYGLEHVNLTETFRGTGFRAFAQAVESGGMIKAICVPGEAERSRSWLSGLEQVAKERGARGMAWVKVQDGQINSPIAKFLSEEDQKALIETCQAKPGDLLLIVADERVHVVHQSMSHLRRHLAKELGLIEEGTFVFTWVDEFPLVEWDAEAGRFDLLHHPFTMPHPEDKDMLKTDPGAVRALSYDLVLNGFELGSGSLRIFDKELQQQIFSLVGLTDEQIQDRFGFFLEALRYGTPPHGGMALGLDRIVMLLAGENSLREVIAFPKTAKATCLVSTAPSFVDEAQLRELSIQSLPSSKEQAKEEDKAS
ncbi:MAG: aspartate--tRNA ligase [Myxococcales bacterium]|nr:aspartate--tRNA ligase [Myxococcales bacterium]